MVGVVGSSPIAPTNSDGRSTMLHQDVLKHPARVLTEAQRAQYFADGFLVLPQYVPAPWLHGDYRPVSIGVYIDGCTAEQGPLSFARGSHQGPLFSQYDRNGNFVVHIHEEDLSWLSDDVIAQAVGGPGTTVLLNCRTVH